MTYAEVTLSPPARVSEPVSAQRSTLIGFSISIKSVASEFPEYTYEDIVGERVHAYLTDVTLQDLQSRTWFVFVHAISSLTEVGWHVLSSDRFSLIRP